MPKEYESDSGANSESHYRDRHTGCVCVCVCVRKVVGGCMNTANTEHPVVELYILSELLNIIRVESPDAIIYHCLLYILSGLLNVIGVFLM